MGINWQDIACKTSSDILEQLGVSTAQGLEQHVIATKQQTYGLNILKNHHSNALTILLRQFQSPFFFMLGAAGGISLFLGETSNAVLIALFVCINVFFGFYQEYHAEKTILDLRNIIAPKTTVRRSGVVKEVVTSDLVPGDIVLIEPGDVLAADMRIVEAQDLVVDESTLTGESEPIKKDVPPAARQVAQTYSSIAYAGTVVVTGTGVGVVVATGNNRALGFIAQQSADIKRESLFARNIKTFTLIMMGLIACTLAMVVVLHTTIRPGAMDISQLLLFAIALAVSILPEGLPVVMTFCLSQGAAKLAKQHVVVKRLSAIEDLGSITTLCSDKTGTLTENNLSVADVYGDRVAVITAATKVNQQLLTDRKDAARSFDEALVKATTTTSAAPERLLYLPFDHQHYCAHALIKEGNSNEAVAYIRGVPEKVFARCKETNLALANRWLHEQGILGRRVIVIAEKPSSPAMEIDQLIAETNFTLLGMVSFQDVIKASAVEAVKKAEDLGINVKIITGDNPEVAGAVGYSIGLISQPTDVITEVMIEAAQPNAKLQLYKTGSIFARMSPQQKYTLVKALEKEEHVGFLGEGINDAPALKMAHVALAVDNATDIAKDAADLILLDRSLGVIIDGIAEGRRIVANTIKYIQLMLICNTSNFYSIAIASLFIDFLPMTPLQILLVNVLSDFPLIAIATDHVVVDDIATPQQYHFKSILTKALVFGVIGSSFDFIVFRSFYTNPKMLQTIWFMFSICSELLMFYVIRTKQFFLCGHRSSTPLMLLSFLSGIITIALPSTSIGQRLFGFIPLGRQEYLFFGALLFCWPLAMELVKMFYNHYFSEN
jgi:Mg2+-importing ATPase